MSVGQIDWTHEGQRFEREIYGLVRAMMVNAMRKYRRPYIAFGDMVDDDAIFACRTWRSLRQRGLEPQEVGIWAIADQAVRMVLGGREFRPVGRGDRCWADSPYNPRNNFEAHDFAPWNVPVTHDEGPETIDLDDDFGAWLGTLDEQDRGIVLAYRGGASDDDVADGLGLRPERMKGRRRRMALSLQEWLDR